MCMHTHIPIYIPSFFRNRLAITSSKDNRNYIKGIIITFPHPRLFILVEP